jgi:hypothetical protein
MLVLHTTIRKLFLEVPSLFVRGVSSNICLKKWFLSEPASRNRCLEMAGLSSRLNVLF